MSANTQIYANPPGENELPSGAKITSGSGKVSQNANTLNVLQNSNKLITNWQTFNIGNKATVNFQQPSSSSIALNRVVTEGASQIHGKLNANGKVFLVNPSGITFSSGARVDVGGLVSSTLNISDDDFLNGNMEFENNNNVGSIVNQGHLSSANGGYVALISPRVINDGTITTPEGTSAVAAGNKVSLDFAGDQLVNLTVDQGAIDALIANKGLIQADNGTVMMSAKAADHLTRSVVNNSGVIEAQGIVEQGGRILLTAEGGEVNIANSLDVSSDTAQAGDVIVTGDSISLAGNTTINARGATGGGDVLVGGDWQGSGDLHQATTVTMEEGASINASATNQGDGGKIVLWSDIKNKDSATSVAGTLTARGGANGGDGGAIETSGSHIDTANVAVNAGAEKGTGGLWLIDPYSYSIEAAEAVNISNTLNTGTSVTVTTTVDNASQGSNGIDAANGGTLRVLSAITKTSGGDATLTLKSDRNMEIEDSITSTDGKLNLVLWANQDGAGQGSVAFESDTSGVTHDLDITTNGGHLWIGGGSGSTIWNGLTVGDGAAHAIASGSFTSGIQFFNQTTNITTAGGSIYMAGTTDFSHNRDIRLGINNATTIDAGSGSIELVGDNITFANDSTLETTGELIISPFGTSFVDGSNAATAFTWDGTRVGSNLDGAASLNGLIINNVDSLGGLTLGKDGTTSEIIINADTDIAGDVSVYASTIDVIGDLTAAGDILLDADTGSQLGYNGIGVTIGNATVSTTAASNGSITIEGRGGNVGASAQQGVFLNTNSQITAGGSGDVTITGFGGLLTGSNHHGILLQNNNGITAGGDIVLSGNGGGLVGGSGNHDGVRLENGKIGSDSSGSVTINGTTNGLGSAVEDILIFGAGSEIRTGAGNDILLRGDSFGLSDNSPGSQSTMIGNSTSAIGTLTFESVSDSFYVTGFTLPKLTLENLADLVVGKASNTAEVTVDTALTLDGSVDIFGGDITTSGVWNIGGAVSLYGDGDTLAVEGQINTTSDNVLLKTTGNIELVEDSSVTTLGGDITLWSDSDANNDGRVFKSDASVLDSRTAADRSSNTHTSGGGNITLSGGTDLNTGYAQSNGAHGASVGGTLYSGGGDVLIRGKSNTGSTGVHGVNIRTGVNLLSGEGSINIAGESGSGSGVNIATSTGSPITLSSAKTSGDAIVIDAQSSLSHGLFFNYSSTKKELSATAGGDIRITGESTAANSFGVYAAYTSLLASSGTITLDAGSNGLGGGGGSSFSDLVFGSEAGSSVTASSSDVDIISDQFNSANSFEQFVDTTGHLTIAPSSTAFNSAAHGVEFGLDGLVASNLFTGSNDLATLRIRNYDSLGGLTVGKQDSTSHIAINSAQTINGDINLLGGDITLNAALTAEGSNTISLTSSGNITDSASGFVVADNLALLGGNVTLDHASNNVGTLAANNVGNLSYSDSDALTIGVVDASNGITASGAIDVSTLVGNLTTTEAVSGDSVILNAGKNTAAGIATGGNLLFSGSSSVTAATANARLYSGSISGSSGLTDLIASGSGNFRYNSDESATNYSAVLGATGNYAIYREQPSVTLVADNKTVTYGTAATLTTSLGSGQNGDTISQAFSTLPTISVGGSTSSSGNYTAGNHSLTASGAVDQLGYAISGYTDGTLTVNKKDLTISSVTSGNKTYDGNTSTTTDFASAVYSGLLSGDALALSSVTGVFDNKNVGTNKTVSLSSNYSGADVGNYNITDQASTLATITAKDLTVSGITASDKTYDSTTTATTDFSSAVYSGLLSGDALSLSSVTGVFDNKNVGTNKTVSLTSSYSGADVGNYNITDQASTLATITAKDLTISGISAANKSYDGNTSASTDFASAVYTGLVGGDALSLSSVTGVFDNKNAGTNKTVSLTSSYSGADVGNYNITDQASTLATINQRDLTISGITASDKTYDSNTTATTDFASAVYTGLLSGDALSLSSVTGVFDNKNAGIDKTVSLTSSYSGADVGNYNITDQASTLATITAKDLTISGITASDKTYDSTTTATTDFSSAVYSGLLSGDTLSLSSVTGVFDNKNVGTNKTVSLTSSYSGADVGNYNITDQASTLANISQKDLTVSGIRANNKTYDGNTTATTNLTNAVYTGLLSGDALSLSSVTGVFDNKNAGIDKTVSLTSSYSGADVGNYNITDQASTLANINQRDLTISGITASDKTYDSTTTATTDFSSAVYSGLLSGDTLSLSSVTGVFDNKNVGTNKTVSLTSSYSGADVSNYNITDQASTLATINQRDLAIGGITANDKTYNGNTTATTNFASAIYSGLLSGDALSLSSVTGVFDNKNVGTNKTVSLTSSYSGADVGNYNITDQASTLATITAKDLTISGISAANKSYDGNTSASTDFASAVYTGLVGGDALSLSSVTGVFDNKNAGTDKTVSLTSSYSGADVGNYNITDQASTLATITAKDLTISGITASDKTYNGNTTATTNFASAVYTGLVGGDALSLSSVTGVFDNKNAGTDKTVSLTSSYSGADMGNYNIIDQASSVADITPKSLTINLGGQGSKVYDSTATIDLAGVMPTLSGILTGDDVNVDSGNVTGFVDKNIGMNKFVEYTGFGITGSDIGNYSLTANNAASTATISARDLIVSGITVSDKIYDGATTAALDISGVSVSGLISGDLLSFDGSHGVFDSKNVGDDKTVMLTNSYSGVDRDNYNIIDQTSLLANITRKDLTVSGITINDKTYDGSTAATANFSNVVYAGLINGDDLSLSNVTAVFDNKNAGVAKTVSLSSDYRGVDLGNYLITDQLLATANIDQRALNIIANSLNKSFDDIPFSGGNGVTFSGLVAGETPAVLDGSLSYSGSSQGAVGTGIYAITPGGYSSDNYAITLTSGLLQIGTEKEKGKEMPTDAGLQLILNNKPADYVVKAINPIEENDDTGIVSIREGTCSSVGSCSTNAEGQCVVSNDYKCSY